MHESVRETLFKIMQVKIRQQLALVIGAEFRLQGLGICVPVHRFFLSLVVVFCCSHPHFVLFEFKQRE